MQFNGVEIGRAGDLKQGHEYMVMFTYRRSLKKTAKAVDDLLHSGWKLISINADRCLFEKDNQDG